MNTKFYGILRNVKWQSFCVAKSQKKSTKKNEKFKENHKKLFVFKGNKKLFHKVLVLKLDKCKVLVGTEAKRLIKLKHVIALAKDPNWRGKKKKIGNEKLFIFIKNGKLNQPKESELMTDGT